MISHDVHSNTYNYKFSFSVDVVPVCKVGPGAGVVEDVGDDVDEVDDN